MRSSVNSSRRKRLLVLVLGLLLCALWTMASAQEPLQLSVEERAWIEAHPVVRMGIDRGYGPYSFIDKEGKPAGLAVDLLHEIEGMTGLHFEIVSDLDWTQLMDALRARRIDAIATVVDLPERRGFIAFTDIYLPTPLVVITRKETPPLHSLDELHNLRLALVKGYSSTRQIIARFPELDPALVDTPADGLRAVASGAADAYIGALGVNSFLAHQLGLANLRVNAAVDMHTNGQRIGVRKDWPELAGILDKALKALPADRKEALFRRWLPTESAELARIGEAAWWVHWGPWLLGAATVLLLVGFFVWLWGWQMRRRLRERTAELRSSHVALEAGSRRLQHLVDASPVILYNLRFDSQGRLVPIWVSDNIERELGYPVESALRPDFWLEHLHPDDRASALKGVHELMETGQYTHEYRFFDAEGKVRWIDDELRLERSPDGQVPEVIGAWRDITAEKFSDFVQETRLWVLEQIAAEIDLDEILENVALTLERLRPEMRVSILLRDPRRGQLATAAAPSLPEAYNEAIDAMDIREGGPGKGSCGNAMALDQVVVVGDVFDHPYWEGGEELARLADIRACWSFPLHDQNGAVIGTFAVYFSQPTEPDRHDLVLLQEFAQITALAVQRAQRQTELLKAAAVLESTRDGVFTTDLDGTIISVNRAFTDITGYTAEEAQGQTPRMLKSDRHDNSFYQALWANVRDVGHWAGEIWNRRKNGEIYPQWMSISTVRDSTGQATHYVAVFSDLSEVRESQERAEFLAHYDPLTELPNRLLFQAQLKHALQQAARHGTRLAVLMFDLDRFKPVNDSLGHEVGDALLQAVASRLRELLRINDTLARIGSDEFALLLEEVERETSTIVIAEKVLHAFAEPFQVDGQELFITPSIGVSLYPNDGESCEALLRAADAAMFSAKQQGGNTFAFYSEELTATAFQRVMLEASLRRAVEGEQLILHYQPQIDLASGRMTGVEALLRWQHPELGMVRPDQFIPLAEATGLMVEIGEWVLHEACHQARSWLDEGLDIRVAVNVGDVQIRRGVIEGQVDRALRASGLPADHLVLEVLESFVMDQAEAHVSTLHALRSKGVHLSMDDFGTGYSSLAYLRHLPLSELKIDKSFVSNIQTDESSQAIVRAIVALGASLDLEVLAEGVEEPEQQEFLMKEGCRLAQGYLFARPMPPEELKAFAAEAR